MRTVKREYNQKFGGKTKKFNFKNAQSGGNKLLLTNGTHLESVEPKFVFNNYEEAYKTLLKRNEDGVFVLYFSREGQIKMLLSRTRTQLNTIDAERVSFFTKKPTSTPIKKEQQIKLILLDPKFLRSLGKKIFDLESKSRDLTLKFLQIITVLDEDGNPIDLNTYEFQLQDIAVLGGVNAVSANEFSLLYSGNNLMIESTVLHHLKEIFFHKRSDIGLFLFGVTVEDREKLIRVLEHYFKFKKIIFKKPLKGKNLVDKYEEDYPDIRKLLKTKQEIHSRIGDLRKYLTEEQNENVKELIKLQDTTVKELIEMEKNRNTEMTNDDVRGKIMEKKKSFNTQQQQLLEKLQKKHPALKNELIHRYENFMEIASKKTAKAEKEAAAAEAEAAAAEKEAKAKKEAAEAAAAEKEAAEAEEAEITTLNAYIKKLIKEIGKIRNLF
jgi:hypothetical protein